MGIYWSSNGNIYKGEFKNDVPEGKGEIVYKNGDNYKGDFRAGVKHGIGVETFANGYIYKGSYVNDKAHGIGRIYLEGEQVLYGEFFEDALKVNLSRTVNRFKQQLSGRMKGFKGKMKAKKEGSSANNGGMGTSGWSDSTSQPGISSFEVSGALKISGVSEGSGFKKSVRSERTANRRKKNDKDDKRSQKKELVVDVEGTGGILLEVDNIVTERSKESGTATEDDGTIQDTQRELIEEIPDEVAPIKVVDVEARKSAIGVKLNKSNKPKVNVSVRRSISGRDSISLIMAKVSEFAKNAYQGKVDLRKEMEMRKKKSTPRIRIEATPTERTNRLLKNASRRPGGKMDPFLEIFRRQRLKKLKKNKAKVKDDQKSKDGKTGEEERVKKRRERKMGRENRDRPWRNNMSKSRSRINSRKRSKASEMLDEERSKNSKEDEKIGVLDLGVIQTGANLLSPEIRVVSGARKGPPGKKLNLTLDIDSINGSDGQRQGGMTLKVNLASKKSENSKTSYRESKSNNSGEYMLNVIQPVEEVRTKALTPRRPRASVYIDSATAENLVEELRECLTERRKRPQKSKEPTPKLKPNANNQRKKPSRTKKEARIKPQQGKSRVPEPTQKLNRRLKYNNFWGNNGRRRPGRMVFESKPTAETNSSSRKYRTTARKAKTKNSSIAQKIVEKEVISCSSGQSNSINFNSVTKDNNNDPEGVGRVAVTERALIRSRAYQSLNRPGVKGVESIESGSKQGTRNSSNRRKKIRENGRTKKRGIEDSPEMREILKATDTSSVEGSYRKIYESALESARKRSKETQRSKRDQAVVGIDLEVVSAPRSTSKGRRLKYSQKRSKRPKKSPKKNSVRKASKERSAESQAKTKSPKRKHNRYLLEWLELKENLALAEARQKKMRKNHRRSSKSRSKEQKRRRGTKTARKKKKIGKKRDLSLNRKIEAPNLNTSESKDFQSISFGKESLANQSSLLLKQVKLLEAKISEKQLSKQNNLSSAIQPTPRFQSIVASPDHSKNELRTIDENGYGSPDSKLNEKRLWLILGKTLDSLICSSPQRVSDSDMDDINGDLKTVYRWLIQRETDPSKLTPATTKGYARYSPLKSLEGYISESSFLDRMSRKLKEYCRELEGLSDS